MTKKQLIESLEPFDDNLEVILYHSVCEDAAIVNLVELETEENSKYCKGYHPFEYKEVFKDKKEAIILMS